MDEKKARKAITDILLDIGAGEHLLGFPMLEDAILAWMNGEHQHIYKTLAVKYNCTQQTVERRIRSCIHYAFQNCNQRVAGRLSARNCPGLEGQDPELCILRPDCTGGAGKACVG